MRMDGVFVPMEVHQTYCCLVESQVSQYIDPQEAFDDLAITVFSTITMDYFLYHLHNPLPNYKSHFGQYNMLPS